MDKHPASDILNPPLNDMAAQPLVRADAWQALRQHTAARIALGRVGASLPTAEVLRLGLAHAQARDAVHTPLDFAALCQLLHADDWQPQLVRSQALNRQSYLLRPDLGRRLHADDANRLRQHAGPNPVCELAIVVADGLSSAAVQHHAAPLLAALKKHLQTDWATTPLVLAEQGRVALGDDIGELLGARLVVLLIGERPGLSSPASLGIYITFSPRIGRMDSERNCISNVRPEGLPYDQAAHKLAWLCRAALRGQVTGVALKDDSQIQPLAAYCTPGRPW